MNRAINGWRFRGEWVHRPWWKGIINDVLRWLQRGNPRPWLICSHFNGRIAEPGSPAVGYSFRRIRLRRA